MERSFFTGLGWWRRCSTENRQRQRKNRKLSHHLPFPPARRRSRQAHPIGGSSHIQREHGGWTCLRLPRPAETTDQQTETTSFTNSKVRATDFIQFLTLGGRLLRTWSINKKNSVTFTLLNSNDAEDTTLLDTYQFFTLRALQSAGHIQRRLPTLIGWQNTNNNTWDKISKRNSDLEGALSPRCTSAFPLSSSFTHCGLSNRQQ